MRNLRLALLGLAALSALLLGLGFLERALKSEDRTPAGSPAAVPAAASAPPSSAPEAETRQKLDALIAQSPDYGRFFDRLHAVFPADYDGILDQLARNATAAKKLPAPDVLLADTVSALRKVNGGFASKAPDDALARIFAIQLKEMQALGRRDTRLCVAFLFGANGPGLLEFAASHRDLIADAALSGLEAMNSGRRNPVQRGAPTDADFQALDKALSSNGLSRAEIDALLDGKTPEPPIPDERMCQAGQVYLQTMAALDPATRGRLYSLAVDLMVKS